MIYTPWIPRTTWRGVNRPYKWRRVNLEWRWDRGSLCWHSNTRNAPWCRMQLHSRFCIHPLLFSSTRNGMITYSKTIQYTIHLVSKDRKGMRRRLVSNKFLPKVFHLVKDPQVSYCHNHQVLGCQIQASP